MNMIEVGIKENLCLFPFIVNLEDLDDFVVVDESRGPMPCDVIRVSSKII